MKRIAVSIIILLVLIEGGWLIVLSEGTLKGLIENSLGNDSIYLLLEGFKKGLFYDFSAEKLSLRKRGSGRAADSVLWEVDALKGRTDFLSVLALRPEVVIRCNMGDGEIAGRVALTDRGSTSVSGSNIRVRELPFLEALGIHAEGILSGSFSAQDNEGSVKISLTDAALRNSSVVGVLLPLDVFHDVKGAATIRNGTLEIQSLAMSGNGIYGRVRGSAARGNMNMSFELMADPSFRLEPLVQAMIERYKVTPGYYVFPLKGDIFGAREGSM